MRGRKRTEQAMRALPRFVYNPEKVERGLRAMADILAEALRQAQVDERPGRRLYDGED